MRSIDISLSANQQTTVHRGGEAFVIMAAAGDIDITMIMHDGTLHVVEDRGTGYRWRTRRPGERAGRFRGLIIKDKSGATNAVTIGIAEDGEGIPEDAAAVVTVTKPTTLATTADASVTTTAAVKVAANATRHEVIVEADPGNTDNVRVGDSAVAVARGIELQPGQSARFACTAALWAVANSGTQTLQIIEVND